MGVAERSASAYIHFTLHIRFYAQTFTSVLEVAYIFMLGEMEVLYICVGSNAFYSVTSFSALFYLGIVMEIGNHACISVIKVRSPSRM